MATFAEFIPTLEGLSTSIPNGDIAWIMVVLTAAFGFVQLAKQQEPEAQSWALTLAVVTVFGALLWVAVG
jgi:hypothetical protein